MLNQVLVSFGRADTTKKVIAELQADGAPSLSPPHNFLSNLRVAWVADPDGNPIQLAQHRKRDNE